MRLAKMDLNERGQLVETQVREINPTNCPHYILASEHWRDDGTCRCNDPDHREMAGWGYEWCAGAWR